MDPIRTIGATVIAGMAAIVLVNTLRSRGMIEELNTLVIVQTHLSIDKVESITAEAMGLSSVAWRHGAFNSRYIEREIRFTIGGLYYRGTIQATISAAPLPGSWLVTIGVDSTSLDPRPRWFSSVTLHQNRIGKMKRRVFEAIQSQDPAAIQIRA